MNMAVSSKKYNFTRGELRKRILTNVIKILWPYYKKIEKIRLTNN